MRAANPVCALPEGLRFVIGMRDLDSGIQEEADFLKVSFVTASERADASMIKTINEELLRIGSSMVQGCVDEQPSLEAHFKTVYQEGLVSEDRFLAPKAISLGEGQIQNALDRAVMAKSKAIAAMRSFRIVQVRFPKNAVPSWVFDTPTLTLCMVVRDGAALDFVGLVSVHSTAIKIRRLHQAVRALGHDRFDPLFAKQRNVTIASADTVPPCSSGNKTMMKEFMDLSNATVLKEAFLTPVDYRMALGTGLTPREMQRRKEEIALFSDFAPVCLDPAMAPVLDTALIHGLPIDNFRASYLFALREYTHGSGRRVLNNASSPDIGFSLSAVASLKGVPCARTFSAGYSPYGSEHELMFVVMFPWLLPRDMIRTYNSVAKTREELVAIRSGRSNNAQNEIGDQPVTTFLLSGTALIVEEVARAEQEALSRGELEFEVPLGHVSVYNSYIFGVPGISVAYSPQERSLVIVSKTETSAFVMRSFVHETYTAFNEMFKDAEVADDGVVPSTPIVIVDAPGRSPYYDVVDAGMAGTSVFIAPSMDVAISLERDMHGLEIHAPGSGRLVFTRVLDGWHRRIKNVVFVCAHLWDSVAFCQTAMALHRAFGGATLWLFGDLTAEAQAYSARLNGVTGSIYYSLVKEALANDQKNIGVHDPVPRVAFDVSALFLNQNALPLSGIPQSSAAVGKAMNMAMTGGMTGHLIDLVKAGFVTNHAHLWTDIMCVNISAFFDTGSSSSILSFLRETGVSYAVVIDAPRPYEAYLRNARRAVDNLSPEDPDDLVKRGTVLACRNSGLRYVVTHILDRSGSESGPFPLSAPMPGTCMWLEPQERAVSMHEKAVNPAKSMLVTEVVARFVDEFKIASVVPVTETPVVDYVLFFSRTYEQRSPFVDISLSHAEAFLPEEGTQEFDTFDESDCFHMRDRKILLGAIPETVVRMLCESVRRGLFLGYTDDKCAGFSDGPNHVSAFDTDHSSLLSNASTVALPCDPISGDLAAKECEEVGGHVPESESAIKCSELAAGVLSAALKMRYDPPSSKKKKSKKSRAQSPSEMVHSDDADLDASDYEEESEDVMDENDLGFVVADEESNSGSDEYDVDAASEGVPMQTTVAAPTGAQRSLSLSLSPSPPPRLPGLAPTVPEAPHGQAEQDGGPASGMRGLFGSISDEETEEGSGDGSGGDSGTGSPSEEDSSASDM